MNAPIDTLAFAQSFEAAGLDQGQARAIASAFGKTYGASREDVVTRDVLRAELAEIRTEIKSDLATLKSGLTAATVEMKSDLAALQIELVREIATAGKDANGRLWSTITIIAGAATAISATISAAVALLLKAGGL